MPRIRRRNIHKYVLLNADHSRAKRGDTITWQDRQWTLIGWDARKRYIIIQSGTMVRELDGTALDYRWRLITKP